MARIDPHAYFDTDQPRAKHVRLRWHVDFHTQQITGDATLVFEQPSSGRVDLDSKGLTIEAVRTSAGSSVAYTLGDDEPILGQRLQLDLPAHTSEVTIAYRTVTAGDGAAVARPGPDRRPALSVSVQPVSGDSRPHPRADSGHATGSGDV